MRVTAQKATPGPYDFVNIVEAADYKIIASVSAELASRGSIKITMLPAIGIEEFIKAPA